MINFFTYTGTMFFLFALTCNIEGNACVIQTQFIQLVYFIIVLS